MKRVLCLVIAMMLAVIMACSVFAANGSENDDEIFVSSVAVTSGWIKYENNDGEHVWGEIVEKNDLETSLSIVDKECLRVISLFEAMHNADVPADVREKLIDMYYSILDNTVELPYEKINKRYKPEYMVIRELIDLEWLCDEHKEWDEKEDHYVKLTFDLGIEENIPVYVMVYDGEEWVPGIEAVNNDDGTVTVIIQDVGMIAFSVIDEEHMPLWMTGMWDYVRKVASYLI